MDATTEKEQEAKRRAEQDALRKAEADATERVNAIEIALKEIELQAWRRPIIVESIGRTPPIAHHIPRVAHIVLRAMRYHTERRGLAGNLVCIAGLYQKLLNGLVRPNDQSDESLAKSFVHALEEAEVEDLTLEHALRLAQVALESIDEVLKKRLANEANAATMKVAQQVPAT